MDQVPTCISWRAGRESLALLWPKSTHKQEIVGKKAVFMLVLCWRRGSESNRRIKVLQTSPLPLGYRARSLTVEPRLWVCLEAMGYGNGAMPTARTGYGQLLAPWLTRGLNRARGSVRVFSQLNLCYNTGHEFNIAFDRPCIRFHDVSEVA
jgi:hypothetical protein